MYHVFVVEDELLIRQSIRGIIENMSGPYVCCGEASDGEMALSMMQDMMPDILLTDIRMPFLDGFELIRHLKTMMPWLKIVIISGYGDFEYAQKAITLGVDLYLLKPVRAADLTGAVEEMARRIDEDRRRGTVQEGFDRDEVQTALHAQFVRQLLYGRGDVGALLEKARTLRIDIAHPFYQVVMFSFDSENIDYPLLERATAAVLAQTGIGLVCIDDPSRMTVLFCGSLPEALNEEIYRFNAILRHQLQDICTVITTVIGSAVQRLSAIGEACRAVSDLLKKSGGVFAGRVVNINDTASVMAEIMESDNPFGEEFQKKLQYAVADDVPELVEGILAGPAGDTFGSMLFRYQALSDTLKLYARMSARVASSGSAREAPGQRDILNAAQTREGFRRKLEEILGSIIALRQESAGDLKYTHVISRAKAYISANFCDPNISLISTAKHVAMSPAHFSAVFSQTTGESFIAFLTAMRLSRAKALLTETDKKLSDIAMEIGYNEPNYFSHVFRKSEGVTPKEYRTMHQK